jgi:glucosamine--fructose-6-phosphate aminotransferase (isomerizing)
MKGSLMAAEMAEQPAVLSRLIARREELHDRIRSVVPEDPAGVVLVARGSSDNAAIYGRYVLEAAIGRPVSLAAPSLHTIYKVKADYRGYLAVGVSQSGQTPEIATVLERARAAGARTIAITNNRLSPLAEAVEAVIDMQAGEERAIPATKTFTAQVAAFAVLAEELGEVPWDDRDWKRVSGSVAEVLPDAEPAKMVAGALLDAEGLISVARGYLFCVALETALKIKETSGLLAQGYSAADLRHGPMAAIEQGLPVVAFTAAGPATGDMADLIQALRGREARVFEVRDDAGADLPVPAGIDEPLVTIPMAVRGQQVSHALALERGLDPDRPLGLAKLTAT